MSAERCSTRLALNRVSRVVVPGLNQNVLVFFAHSALIHIGMLGIADVLLNFYYVSLGYGPGVIGILQSMPRLGGFLTGVPIGMIANRLGKRRILILANIGMGASYLLLVLFPTLWMLGISRFLLGFFYGANQIVTSPYMVTLTPKDEHTQQFAYHNLISMVSVALGSVIGGYLPLQVSRWLSLEGTALLPPEQTITAYSISITVAGIVILLGALPLWWLPIDAPMKRKKTVSDTGVGGTAPWGLLLLFAVPLFFFGITGGLTFPFYNLLFRESFGLPDGTVGNILAFGWIGMALVPLLNPLMERRLGRSWSLALLMGIAAVGFVGLGLAGSLVLAVPFFLIGISVRNGMQPLFQPLVMSVLPEEHHNLNSSIGLVSWNIGWFGSTASFGWLLPLVGYSGMMLIVAVGVIITGASIVLVFAHRERDLISWTTKDKR
ncbi:MAG: MFS transporter [Chloroflexota bacterium]